MSFSYPLGHLRASSEARMDSPKRVVIFSDFDGTISHQDSLKLLLNRFGGAHWPVIENAMTTGEMPERIGLQRSFDKFALTFESALSYVLREVKVDPFFKHFASWVKQEGYELSVLSGGFENFIRPLLGREGLNDIQVLANRVNVRSGVWNVSACAVERLCPQCNHCKSASLVNEIVKDPDVILVYIGDGLTDTCAIQLADFVFAKGFLEQYCLDNKIQFMPFNDFSEIKSRLPIVLPRQTVAA